MFGTLKPKLSALEIPDRSAHQRFYCGLCKTVGDDYGQVWRGVHSYDAVLVGLLADALQGAASEAQSCRCPMMPLIHRDALDPSGVAIRYASAVQMLLGDQWLADKSLDGNRPATTARPLMRGVVQRAWDVLDTLGVDLSALDGFEHTQKQVERAGDVSLLQAAEPTAQALGVVFATAAKLPGTADQARTDAAEAELTRLGRAVGRLIYAIDALEDAEDDARSRAFNPCLAQDGSFAVSPWRVEAACEVAQRELTQARHALNALPWQRHADLLTHIVSSRLGERVERASAKARAAAQPAARAELARWRTLGPFGRAHRGVMQASVMLWVWLVYVLPASADTREGGEALPESITFGQCAEATWERCKNYGEPLPEGSCKGPCGGRPKGGDCFGEGGCCHYCCGNPCGCKESGRCCDLGAQPTCPSCCDDVFGGCVWLYPCEPAWAWTESVTEPLCVCCSQILILIGGAIVAAVVWVLDCLFSNCNSATVHGE